ncbi:hypothetical protein C3K47_01360 [Solitalea longa]|uniref:Outer membrane protein beta-barrel domain-containing protein n=1 Tax=Solitalea longa TaxID=2079460 RepID=A0A2S5A9A2_9SPHI|nr:hypothetical protein [Solitalea longa]POY39171.1 hypothetical protein C3K47_01360 [Solitalea longa]
MKRLTLLAILFVSALMVSNHVNAQAPAGKKLLNIAFESGFPLGNAADVYKIVLGGSLQAEFPVKSNLSVTATAGYSTFTNSKIDGLEGSGFIPVKVGGKYYFASNFYGIGELGAAFYTGDGSSTTFVYAPGLGYSFPVADNKFVDVSARYEGHTGDFDRSFFGLRFAYSFGF